MKHPLLYLSIFLLAACTSSQKPRSDKDLAVDSSCVEQEILTVTSYLPKFEGKFDYKDAMEYLEKEGFMVLDLPKYKKFMYVDKHGTEGEDLRLHHWVHFVDYESAEETNCDAYVNDYPIYLLPGENDSIVFLISEGGSGHFCVFCRIDVVQMKEVEAYDMDVQRFRIVERTENSFKGIGSDSLLDGGPIRILNNFEIDFHGRNIKKTPLTEWQKHNLDLFYDI